METEYNPIRSVAPVGGGAVTVPPPSSMVWKLEDISSATAGRLESGKMMKNQVGQTVGLELSWQNIQTSDASKILKAFNHEYLLVTYLDPMVGGFTTLEMYVGNRSAPMYNAKIGLWQNVSFNLIDRNGANK